MLERFAACLALLLTIAVAATHASEGPTTAPAVAPDAARATTASTLADFAWLAGRWVERGEGTVSEEHWQGVEGDCMLGTWRLVSRGAARVLELLQLRQEEAGVFMHLLHFDGGMVPWEGEETPLRMTATAPEPGVAIFEGTGTDGEPVRITYRRVRRPDGRDGYDGLLEHGEERQEFHFTREEGW